MKWGINLGSNNPSFVCRSQKETEEKNWTCSRTDRVAIVTTLQLQYICAITTRQCQHSFPPDHIEVSAARGTYRSRAQKHSETKQFEGCGFLHVAFCNMWIIKKTNVKKNRHSKPSKLEGTPFPIPDLVRKLMVVTPDLLLQLLMKNKDENLIIPGNWIGSAGLTYQLRGFQFSNGKVDG